jgi:cytoskeletal protein CcmA (bactofilin family)
MFGRTTKTEIDSLIGISARIEGNLRFTGGLRVDGEVHGDVLGGDSADNVLIVSEHARIEGDVRCATLIVDGYIAGDVFATELLELQPKGRIVGNVHYKTLEMHSGATVAGTLTHQEPGEPEFHMVIQPPAFGKGSEARIAPTVYNDPH